MSIRITRLTSLAIAAGMLLAACAGAQRQSGSAGSTHTHRSQLPAEKAARCFARNAEAHSGALVAEVVPTAQGAQTIVRVKNGVTYATAEYRRARNGSVGTIELMVITSGRRNDLYGALVEGC